MVSVGIVVQGALGSHRVEVNIDDFLLRDAGRFSLTVDRFKAALWYAKVLEQALTTDTPPEYLEFWGLHGDTTVTRRQLAKAPS